MATGKPGESAMARAEASRPSSNASSSSSAGIRDGGMRTNGGGQASNFGGGGGYSGNSGNFGSGSMATARASDRASVAGYSPASRNFTTSSGGGGYAPGLGAALNAGLGLRGVTGPFGEPRIQPTPYGTNYQTAQLYRAAYPSSVGQYDQTRVTNALNLFSKALPGEADYNRYGPGAFNNLARVGLNQIVGGYNPEKMVAGMDTTGLRPATRGYNVPGPNSIGMTDNWANKVRGAAYEALAANAIRESLFNQGVSPIARDASNFVAAGTPMVSGVRSIGQPVHGTQFGSDPTWGNRIANRNATAMGSPALASLDDRSIGGPLSSPASTAPVQVATRAPVFADMGAPLPKASAPKAAPTGPTPITNEAFAQEAVQRLQAAGVDVQRLQVPQAAPRPQAAQTLASVDRQPPMARPSTVSPGSAMQPLGPAVNVSTLNTYQAPPRIGTRVASVPYNFPTRMPPSKSTAIKTGTNTLAATIPGIGLFNTLASPFGYSAGDAAVWNMNKSLNAPVGSNTSASPTGGSALANYQGRVGGNGREGGGRDNPNKKPSNKPSKPINDVKTPDAVWKQAALDNGYTEAQLKDPEIAALIKQLYDMGFLETNTA